MERWNLKKNEKWAKLSCNNGRNIDVVSAIIPHNSFKISPWQELLTSSDDEEGGLDGLGVDCGLGGDLM